MQDDGYHADEPGDLTVPLRERLVELERVLASMRALDEERQRIKRAIDALDPSPHERQLAGPTRSELAVLNALDGKGRLRAREIASSLGYGDPTHVQNSLRRLRDLGLVVRHEIGNRRYAYESASPAERER